MNYSLDYHGGLVAFWARHTPTLRKLTCTHCGYKGFGVEIFKKDKS